ncbi:hypothetical protein ES707_15022 [subsurface metagenome]
MANATKFVSLERFIQEKGFGKDFLLFLDSTMVRVWWLNPQKKEEVRRAIDGLGCGAFLSEEEKGELRLNFNRRYYGDDIYLLKTGYNIFPNFISWLKPHAMHAYHPEDRTQQGIFMFEGKAHNIHKEGAIRLVELAPTILDLLGLDIPGHYEAKSLLR